MANQIENINEYGVEAAKTAIYKSPDYPFALLSEEAGEVIGKINKYARKRGISIKASIVDVKIGRAPELENDLVKELGDVAWALVECCRVLQIPPSVILTENIKKLADRQERSVIDGAGDNR